MKPVDYGHLFNSDLKGRAGKIAAAKSLPIRELYRDEHGFRCAGSDGARAYSQEIVRLAPGAMLLLTQSTNNIDSVTQQLVSSGDWIHLQFRFHGSGQETLCSDQRVSIPEKSCVIARYPENSIVERTTWGAERWEYLCLFMSPEAVVQLLDAPAASLPGEVSWIAESGHFDPCFDVMPLNRDMMLAASDIRGCTYGGSSRRAYLRAKSIELMSSVLHSKLAGSAARVQVDVLSEHDRLRIAEARSIITDEMDGSWSLADIARRVRLNRSKLSSGFRQVYGVPVRQYWRDTNLEKARRLLLGGASVTDVAFDMGYADVYSFTRAFSQKFGLCPRDCKQGLLPHDVTALASRLGGGL